MKKIIKIKKTYFAILAAIVAFAVTACVYIDDFIVTQVIDGKEVSYAYANTEATFTLVGHIECHEDHTGVNFVVGYLVPKSWKLAENGKVTFKCDLAEDHDQILTMSVMPSTSLPKNGGGRTWVECLTQEYGVGTNVIDDMEWVVYQTDDKFNIINNQFPTYTIWLKTNVGDKNLKFHPGVFVNHTDNGFSGGTDHRKVHYAAECFEVVGGKGNVIDFCNAHYNTVSPMAALQNDLITLRFNGTVGENKLVNESEIFVNGTAYTVDGKAYQITEKSAKTKMIRENAYSDNYSITVWPVDLFNVPVTAQIERFEYYFTNADGSITVTQSDDDFIYKGIEVPANFTDREQFQFVFECD